MGRHIVSIRPIRPSRAWYLDRRQSPAVPLVLAVRDRDWERLARQLSPHTPTPVAPAISSCITIRMSHLTRLDLTLPSARRRILLLRTFRPLPFRPLRPFRRRRRGLDKEE